VNVGAKDLATGKEQTITISGSTGLSKEDVSRMVREAESHASEDRSRREVIDARNQADSLAYQVERTLHDNRDKVASSDVSSIESAIAGARAAAKGDDLAAMTQAVDVLQRASHALAEQLYKGSQRAQGQHGSQDSTVKDGEVVDAEYAETV
jgi:molecular chaperone DnaK